MSIHERLRPGKYKLTVDDYVRLAEAGVFGDKRTELLDGTIVVMNAEYRPHGWVRDELSYRLRRALEGIGSPLVAMGASALVSDNDMPLPDIVLTSEPRGEGPIPLASIALVVEVSSTTLRRDLGVKASIYANSNVPEYWVADVNGRVIHQMWQPAEGLYGERREIAFGERIVAATIAKLEVEAEGL